MPVDKATAAESIFIDLVRQIDESGEGFKLSEGEATELLAKSRASIFEAGQKSLSPEVREVFESIKFKLISQKWVKSAGRFMYECTFCLCLSEDKDKINHSTNCFVGKSIKLLAKE